MPPTQPCPRIFLEEKKLEHACRGAWDGGLNKTNEASQGEPSPETLPFPHGGHAPGSSLQLPALCVPVKSGGPSSILTAHLPGPGENRTPRYLSTLGPYDFLPGL